MMVTTNEKIGILRSTFMLVYLIIIICSTIKKCCGLSLPTTNTISYIEGQRCLFLPRSSPNKNNEIDQSPPIVILGGMAQTIASWEFHARTFSRDRDVLVYECLGQGPPPPVAGLENEYVDFYKDVSLPTQAEKLKHTIEQVFPLVDEVDIVGFSLGGRIAMAMCTSMMRSSFSQNTKIRRLHLTGVAAGRSLQGQIAVASWQDLLHHQNVRGFAWSVLMSTYSPAFLVENQSKIRSWVQFIVDSNTSEGLYALSIQTQISNEQDPWHMLQLAKSISIGDGMQRPEGIRLVVGEYDTMSPLMEAQKLQSEFNNHHGQQVDGSDVYASLGVIQNSGHALPTEQGRLWRQDVLSFLDE
mmetsp:Transcript_12204/g.18899  ORF Transcript_12204/g.18899 Transcript_12204/m.18899 type:complete len:356 (+) Transcript_12204:248-1315(+)